jgi:hypothetical protein
VLGARRGAGGAAVRGRSAGDERKRLALLACILGSTVVGIDGSVITVALPAIRDELGGGLAGQQWASNAYLLTLGSLLLLGGALGDAYGERRVFTLGLTGFGVTSLMCAASPTIGVLIAGRALQGASDARPVCRDGDAVLLRRDLPPAGGRVARPRGGTVAIAGDGRDAHALQPIRHARRPARPAWLHDRRPARLWAWPAPAASAGSQRLLSRRAAARRGRVRAGTGHHRGAADSDRAGGCRGAKRRSGVGRQQRRRPCRGLDRRGRHRRGDRGRLRRGARPAARPRQLDARSARRSGRRPGPIR